MAIQKTAKVEACTTCYCEEGETQRNWGYVFTAVAADDGVKLIGEIDADDLKGFIKAGRVKKA